MRARRYQAVPRWQSLLQGREGMSEIVTVDPSTGEEIGRYATMDGDAVEAALQATAGTQAEWAATPVEERSDVLRAVADAMVQRRQELAAMATTEMGKPITEALAEIDKCVGGLRHVADTAPAVLADSPLASGDLDASVCYEPLGSILAIMPWNFPYWQVIRAGASALAAGNSLVLKHADNVTGCALALNEVIRSAGAPEGLFGVLIVDVPRVSEIIKDERIAGITLTGSTRAGRAVAAAAGASLKPTVLELGGSDPFVVLDDADIDAAAACAVRSRYQNAGQVCIAAKRIIVADAVYDEFADKVLDHVSRLRTGDPSDHATQVGPMARADLREELHQQVRRSVDAGARLVVGGRPVPGAGFFYEPTVLQDIPRHAPAASEELFGPVLSLFRVSDDDEAVALANDTEFGLGSSVWSADVGRARRLTRRLRVGHTAVNGVTASDPRLPFGGVRSSGYGRELASNGLLAFVNVHSVTVGVC